MLETSSPLFFLSRLCCFDVVFSFGLAWVFIISSKLLHPEHVLLLNSLEVWKSSFTTHHTQKSPAYYGRLGYFSHPFLPSGKEPVRVWWLSVKRLERIYFLYFFGLFILRENAEISLKSGFFWNIILQLSQFVCESHAIQIMSKVDLILFPSFW